MPSDPRTRCVYALHLETGAPRMQDNDIHVDPTKVLRHKLERIVGGPIANTSNYPEAAQVHVLGRDTSKMRTAVVDALVAAFEAERDALQARIDALTAASQPPTEAEWSERVQAARARARAKGYDETLDREHGPVHLLMWAQDYLRRGRTDDAGGLIDAALAVITRPAAFTGNQSEVSE